MSYTGFDKLTKERAVELIKSYKDKIFELNHPEKLPRNYNWTDEYYESVLADQEKIRIKQIQRLSIKIKLLCDDILSRLDTKIPVTVSQTQDGILFCTVTCPSCSNTIDLTKVVSLETDKIVLDCPECSLKREV